MKYPSSVKNGEPGYFLSNVGRGASINLSYFIRVADADSSGNKSPWWSLAPSKPFFIQMPPLLHCTDLQARRNLEDLVGWHLGTWPAELCRHLPVCAG